MLAAFQALAAPKPRMIWFVWVESTVQVPAQAPGALARAARIRTLKTIFRDMIILMKFVGFPSRKP